MGAVSRLELIFHSASVNGLSRFNGASVAEKSLAVASAAVPCSDMSTMWSRAKSVSAMAYRFCQRIDCGKQLIAWSFYPVLITGIECDGGNYVYAKQYCSYIIAYTGHKRK